MPFSSNVINNSSYSQMVANKFSAPSYIGQNLFNTKVFKPIRGGGKQEQKNNPDT